jgi:hypothetical protein
MPNTAQQRSRFGGRAAGRGPLLEPFDVAATWMIPFPRRAESDKADRLCSSQPSWTYMGTNSATSLVAPQSVQMRMPGFRDVLAQAAVTARAHRIGGSLHLYLRANGSPLYCDSCESALC